MVQVEMIETVQQIQKRAVKVSHREETL